MTASDVSRARSEPCPPHGETEVGGGHGGGVVDAVTDNQHPPPVLLQAVDLRFVFATTG